VVGLSNVERADSESVEELLEEVRTHQVPQDDVPDEYQDKDQAPSALQRCLAGKSDQINGRPRVAT
jgi:hypothetical protein